MNYKTEELLIITLATVLLIATYITIDPSITGHVIYGDQLNEYNATPNTITCKKDGEVVDCDSSLTIQSLQNSDCIPEDNCGFIDIGSSNKSFLKIKFGDLNIPNETIYSTNVTFEYADQKDTFDKQKLKCYNGSSWIKITNPEVTTSEVTKTYNLDECITNYTLANDIKLKFGQFNPNADSGKIYFDYIFVQVFTQIEICQENWTCNNWTECINESQNRTCIDQNNCGTTENKPLEIQNCSIPCQENWTCTNWTECINETQTRICTDLSECGTQENTPLEEQNCTSENETPQEPPSSESSPYSGKPSVTRYKSSSPTITVAQTQEAPKSTSIETKTISQPVILASTPEPEIVQSTPKVKVIGNSIGFSYLAFLSFLLYRKRKNL